MHHFQCALSEIPILPGIYQRFENPLICCKFLYFQELEIKGKKYQKLHWLGYSILSKYKDGREQLSDLDVTNLNNYPTMVFAPVNSYTTETFQPLIWWEKVKKNIFVYINTWYESISIKEYIHWYVRDMVCLKFNLNFVTPVRSRCKQFGHSS